LGDDLGGQDGPLFSPELYREIYKPRHRRLTDLIHRKIQAKTFLHCCGSIYALLEDLIDLGVDVIHPVQVAAKDMDSSILGPEFARRVSFWGGVDSQRVLPYGTPEEVKAEVRRRIADFAPGGGYVLGAVHNIQSGVPPDNIIAMYEAGKEYEHGGLSPQECIVPVITITKPDDAAAVPVTIEQVAWRRLRCVIQVSGATPEMRVDIRTKAGDPATSLATTPKSPDQDGEVSLLVEDEDRIGEAAFVVALAKNGLIRAQILTTIGG